MKTDSIYEICNDNTIQTSWVPGIMEYVFGVVGNFIAILLLWINRREHQWKSFYKLYTGLAITDFLGIFLVYPFVAVRYATDFKWCYSKPLCQFVSFIFVDAHISSALLICAMSVDRYVSLAFPERFNTGNGGRVYTKVLCGIWFGASFFSWLHLIGVGSSEVFYPGSWCYFNFVGSDIGNRVYSFIYSILGAIIILVTLVTNGLILWRTCRDPIEVGILLDLRRVPGFNDAHVLLFIAVMSLVFFVLWSPLLVDVFLHAIGTRTANKEPELWLLRAAVFNTILDPWLYIVLRREFLRKITELYQKYCRSKHRSVINEEPERESLIDNRSREES